MPNEPERYRVERSRNGTAPQKPGRQRPGPQRKPGAPQRQAPQQKRPLPPEERRRREMEARKRREEARAEARQRRLLRKARRKMLFRLSLIAGLVFTVLYWCWVAVSIATRPDGNEDALPLMIFQEGERDAKETLEADAVTFTGKVYLPVTVLEPYVPISQFGDYQTRSFLICESGEYATFYLDSPRAIINGQRICLKEKAFLKDEVLYLPIDFFTEKLNCFTFTESTPLAANVLTFKTSVEPGMRFHEQTDSAPVDVNTIPVAPVTPPPSA